MQRARQQILDSPFAFTYQMSETKPINSTGLTPQKYLPSSAVVKAVDMSNELQTEAIDLAALALSKYNIEKDIASYIKKEFDKKHGPTWQCVVGKNFGSFVTHHTQHFIYFYLGPIAILLFKTG